MASNTINGKARASFSQDGSRAMDVIELTTSMQSLGFHGWEFGIGYCACGPSKVLIATNGYYTNCVNCLQTVVDLLKKKQEEINHARL